MKKTVYIISCLIGLIFISCNSDESKDKLSSNQDNKNMDNFEKLESNLTTSMYSKYLIYEDTSFVDEKYIFDFFNNQSLPYDVKCNVCQKDNWVIMSFSDDLAFEYYLGFMATFCESINNKKSYCIAVNKDDSNFSFYSLYSHSYLKTLKQEYYLGRFENGKNFIVDLIGIIDSDMKTNTFILKENVLTEGIDSFLSSLNLKKSDLKNCYGTSSTEVNIEGRVNKN